MKKKSKGASLGNGKSARVSLDSKGEEKRNTSFPIVGIGASAGGLEAFEQFFSQVPPDSGIAFILVSHLDPGIRHR